MAERKVKCAWCGELGEKSMLSQESNKKYYHSLGCLKLFHEDKEFKQKEREELDVLTDTILEVHNLKLRASIPSSFYPFLNDLRNDSILFGKLQKRYKEGVSYLLIADTYLFCKDKIVWAKANKEFKNTMSELKYCLAIIKNNIENAIKDNSKKVKQEAQTNKLIQNIKTLESVNQRIKEYQRNEIIKSDDENEVDVESLFD